ncbi:hypothetical protein P170DRAFT_514233 [Aspergillus steynii IBT 23096]|uniref:HMG box domain-containing protein n=1 Tax=Aspergillus steynii IBT 23096 TaxID=1392250 RepID=A0A2I2FTI9_9EURO|nr:uncharacterized protein P170DRAFT_514233 [Aspergillus steynii IBT 23096]PLB43936.1 hypothetical protein P170DRAFT_514233 [Aspergillus steynii IBT 23096]
MPLNVVRGGGGALRSLYLNAVSRPFRVAISQHHVRRVCLATHRGSLKPIAGAVPASGILSRQLVNTYATASEDKTDKKKTTTKKKAETTKAKKTTKAASKKTTPAETPKKTRNSKRLTEKEKEAKQAKELRERIKELKALALDPPAVSKNNPWTLMLASKLPETQKVHHKPSEAFQEAARLARNISQEEKDRFTAIAQSNREEDLAKYEKWVKSHSPVEIRNANRARRTLTRLLANGRRTSRFNLLEDDRLVKRPKTPFVFYYQERTGAGDFKHMQLPDMMRLIREEYNGLTPSEKQKYERLHEDDKARYHREIQDVYGETSRTKFE